MKRLIWFTRSSGLDMGIDSVRHHYDNEKGVLPARVAINVDIDRGGRISRRKGWQYTDVTGNCHSLFCDGGSAVFVKGGALTILNSDMSESQIRNVSTNSPMDYTQVGSRIFYTNGAENGFILGNTSYSYTTPSNERYDDTVTLSVQPVGDLLGYHAGRLYSIRQNIAWYSKAFDVNAYNLAGDFFTRESEITFWKSLKDGILVATTSKVVFFRGNDVNSMLFEQVLIEGAFRGSAVYVDCAEVGDGSISGVGLLFAGREGIYLASPTGQVVKLTEKRLQLPNCIYSSAVVSNGRYIVSLGQNLFGNRITVAVNLSTLAVSQYFNYNFNSFCNFNGNTYAAGSNGIVKIDATQTDEVSSNSKSFISAKYQAGPTDFDIRTEKRIRKAEVAIEANGEVKMTVTVNEGTDGAVVSSQLPTFSDNRQHVVEVPFGRDTKGRFYDFTIENVNGADFSVDEIEAFVDVLLRKPEREGVN